MMNANSPAASNQFTFTSIADYQLGQPVLSRVMVAEKELLPYQKGTETKYRLRLVLMDKSGRIETNVWDEAEAWNEKLEKGSVIEIRAQVTSYKDKLDLRINSITPVPRDTVDPADFLPSTKADPGELYSSLQKFIGLVSHPGLQRLLQYVFIDSDLAAKFTEAIAATDHHHAYIGGLLEHTLSVTRNAVTLAKWYGANLDFVIAGALLHDIGKLETYSWNVGFDMTQKGRMQQHIMLGALLIQRILIEQEIELDEDTSDQLYHLIASHHGHYEWGSNPVPQTPEAVILHLADYIDSTMNKIQCLKDRTDGFESEFVEILGNRVRMFFYDQRDA